MQLERRVLADGGRVAGAEQSQSHVVLVKRCYVSAGKRVTNQSSTRACKNCQREIDSMAAERDLSV